MESIQKYPAWSERYRPQRVEDCVLPKDLKKIFTDIVASGTIPDLLLHGSSGLGKTTVARALCAELGIQELFVNASLENGIDTLRTKVTNYASTRSFDGTRKCVIFDEADNMNPQSTQPALRAFTEEFASNVSFVYTCNHASRIIDAIHSRSATVEFTIPNAEKGTLAHQIYRRVLAILENEGVTYDRDVLRELILRHFPDFRRTINELQKYAKAGSVDSGILAQVRDAPYEELIKALTDQDFGAMRKWIASNNDVDSVRLMRRLYDSLYEIWNPQAAPDLVLALGEYSYRAAIAEDKEINLAACLTQIMLIGQTKQ